MRGVENPKKIFLMREHIIGLDSVLIYTDVSKFFFVVVFTETSLQNVCIWGWRTFQIKSKMGGSVLKLSKGYESQFNSLKLAEIELTFGQACCVVFF